MGESIPRTPSIAKSPVTVQKVSLQKILKQKLPPNIMDRDEDPDKLVVRSD